MGTTPIGERDEGRASRNPLARALVDLARAMRFFSRLPVPALPFETDPHAPPSIAGMTRMLPLAGALIAGPAALVLLAAAALGLPSLPAAALAIVVLVLATGALHEDGLADIADGFGGGRTRERRLEIMKDSRIGAFGACALALGLILRVSLLAALLDDGGALVAAAALVSAAALSRIAMMLPLALLPPARTSGASASIGRPDAASLAIGAAIALAMGAAACLTTGLPLEGLALAAALAATAGLALTALSRRMIGGQTGDVAGATQQVAEAGASIGLLIAAAR
ncbi:adenosylcobinamide-GDP ribazoletransferase [Salinarimonas sp.]|uniref:adenosylcobinamide-GDP ribazoletransferase n=1 Tax=Salinarimonas sp. TaxID=2766526 RepID=UPI0039198952